MQLVGKRLIVGVCGGVAAYKSAELVRLLVKQGAQVKVVMTRAATQFITPLTLQALSGHAVAVDLFAAETAMAHIDLARWADMILLAPITANRMAHLAQGLAEDLLDSLCLATSAPIIIAPAMNRVMWAHDATQANLRTLQQRGVRCWGPDEGAQACGEVGAGRLLPPETLLMNVLQYWQEPVLRDLRVMITAGPTQEAIDPVRYISNHSSGKMGYALAQAAHNAGARVQLISGPVHLAQPEGVQVLPVMSAQDMLHAVMQNVAEVDVFIGCAAVADYRPIAVAAHKMKKNSASQQLALEPTVDILKNLIGLEKKPFTVGFAAETQHVEAYAQKKRKEKQLDLIVANRVGARDGGFGSDQNAVIVLGENYRQVYELQAKTLLAQAIVQIIAARLCDANNVEMNSK